jgi:hypothetical protein
MLRHVPVGTYWTLFKIGRSLLERMCFLKRSCEGIVGTQRSGKRGCSLAVLILGVPDTSYASGLSHHQRVLLA